MDFIKSSVAAAAVLTAGFAHSAVYTAYTSTNANLVYGTATVNVQDSQNRYHEYVQANAAAQLPPFTTGFTGVGGSATAKADGTGVSSSAKLNWNRAAVPAPALISGAGSNGTANAQDSLQQSFAGKVRFTLDYELKTVGSSSSASFSFSANVNQLLVNNPYWWSSIDTEYVSFSDSLSNAGAFAKKTGTWTSDWYDFSSQSELSSYWWWSAPSFSYSLNSYTSAGITNKLTGDTSAIANVRFGYEVAPVPEPETYALLAGGLGLVVATARRRKAGKR